MKTKHHLTITAILMVPCFIACICNFIFAMSYQQTPIEKLSTFNHDFAIWCSSIGFLCFSYVITVFIFLTKHSKHIDNLQAAKDAYYKAAE